MFDTYGVIDDEETDLNNPDSGGDGASDGAEVLAGRNPLLNEATLMMILLQMLEE